MCSKKFFSGFWLLQWETRLDSKLPNRCLACSKTHITYNTAVSPNFMMWKFMTFHKISTLGNYVKLRYFTQWDFLSFLQSCQQQNNVYMMSFYLDWQINLKCGEKSCFDEFSLVLRDKIWCSICLEYLSLLFSLSHWEISF